MLVLIVIILVGGGYNPLTDNLMSYYSDCRNKFSVEQGERMLDQIANSSALIQTLIPENVTVANIAFPFLIPVPSCQNPFPSQSCFVFNSLYIGKSSVSTSGTVSLNQSTFQNQTTKVGFISENEIILQPGFSANEGVFFAAAITEVCPPSITYRFSNEGQTHLFDLEDFYSTTVRTMDTTSLKLRENINSIIFPNPSNGELKIIPDIEENTLIILYDINGLIVFKSKIISNQNYDFSFLSDGIYFVELTYCNNKKERFKWVKSN